MQTMGSWADATWRPALRVCGDALWTASVAVDRRPSWLADRPPAVRRGVVVLACIATLVGYGFCANLAHRAHPAAGSWAAWIGLAEVLPLAVLVRHPLWAWRLGWLAALLTPLAPGRPWGSWPWDPPQIPVFLLVFTVAGLLYARPVRWAMWALMLGVLWLWVPDPADSVGGSIALTVVTVALDLVAGRGQARRDLSAQSELTRHEQARRVVLEERARIARELHDVVAHHLSLIAVHAETAPYRHDGVEGPVRGDFGTISATAREALTEMRRLLGVLRSEDPDEAAARAPQPGLTDLPQLIDGARHAGLLVESSIHVNAEVPAAVGLCAYRIIQESLSNAGRHAPGAAVTVTVRHDPHGLEVDVTNGPLRGSAPHAAIEAGRGHGLAGMRERVVLLGGSLSVRPTDGGGFAVRAVLPVGSPS